VLARLGTAFASVAFVIQDGTLAAGAARTVRRNRVADEQIRAAGIAITRRGVTAPREKDVSRVARTL
jgi:hypothetical protein